MTASSFGPKNAPQFADGDAPDVALNPTQAAEYAAKVGNRRVGTTAERTAATGLDVWEGLLWYDTTNGGEYVRKSGAWQVRSMPHMEQQDTTNATIYPRTQTGFGKITGGMAVAASEALTFPAAFSVAPAVRVNYMGYRTAGPFNMVGLSAASALAGSATAVTPAGCQISLENPTGGALDSVNDYYYSWIAVGAA